MTPPPGRMESNMNDFIRRQLCSPHARLCRGAPSLWRSGARFAQAVSTFQGRRAALGCCAGGRAHPNPVLSFRVSFVSTSLMGLLIATTILNAQVRTLDDFEAKDGWTFIKADGVSVNLSLETGVTGKAVRFDYDFTKGTGYGGIQKLFPIDLPDNYEISFYVKAESPANNFEIKFLDGTGNNVWWVNNRNYAFPEKWKKIRIKKRHIQFAWGPTEDHNLKRIDRIEFTVASSVGGKGTLWIDDLRFEPLPPDLSAYPAPTVTASSSLDNHAPNLIADNSTETFWQSQNSKDQEVRFDFGLHREFGGLQICWLKGHYAKRVEVELSRDGQEWERVYAVGSNRAEVSFIRLPEAEARYLKLHLAGGNDAKGFGIAKVKFLDIRSSVTANDFFIYAATNSPAGNFPRYFMEQASYWTVTGVNNDVKEALINEDGMVEVDKARFAIEPMIRSGDKLYNWSNVKAVQSMGPAGNKNGFEFVPSVTWQCGDLRFAVGVMSAGQANVNSTLGIRYEFENLSAQPMAFEFYLLIRPFQVNPYYQFLNLAGGTGKIQSLKEEAGGQITVDDKVIVLQKQYDAFGAGNFDDGNVVDLLRTGTMPANKSASDASGLAQGVIKYSIRLKPGASTNSLSRFRSTAKVRSKINWRREHCLTILKNLPNSGDPKSATSNSICQSRRTGL